MNFSTTNRRVVHVNNDNGACRCTKIRSQWGGKATHTRGECRDLPETPVEEGQRL